MILISIISDNHGWSFTSIAVARYVVLIAFIDAPGISCALHSGLDQWAIM